MKPKTQLQLRIIDMLGASIVASCLIGFGWLVTVGNDGTKTGIVTLRRLVQTAGRDARALRLATARQRTLRDATRKELSAHGQLPDHAPIEAYFQALSASAAQHQLHVIRHEPLASRRYPGLLEQRFAFEVSGSAPNLVRFLQSIERTEYWADVSHLRVQDGSAQRDEGDRTIVAALTLSLFSSPTPNEADSGSQGT